MIKILQYLFLIRFRKLVTKDDGMAIILIVSLYLTVAFLVFKNYEYFKNYILCFFLDSLLYHLQRRDIDFLKLRKGYKTILFLEYFTYSLPFHLILIFKKEFLLVLGILIFNILLINTPRLNFKVIRYPFNLFNAFWHICFRKYKLIYIFPFLAILVYVADKYNNNNLIYFVILLLSIIACMPSFEREREEEIKRNPFSPEKYLQYQFKNTIANTFYIVIPTVVLFCLFQKWEELIKIGLVFIIPLINVILKYLYFKNNLLHQIVFVLFVVLSIALFGIPLFLAPFMYKKAIKNLKIVKHVAYTN